MPLNQFNNLERFELKYHIPADLVPELEAFVRPYCEPDKFTRQSEGDGYWVRSLYVDSPNLLFFRNKLEKVPDRFNMRIRRYGYDEQSKSPSFFEIKRKREDIVQKYRGRWDSNRPEDLFCIPEKNMNLQQCWPAQPSEYVNLERFLRLALEYQAEPVVLTRYKRRAWFGVDESYSRVTFDSCLSFSSCSGASRQIDPWEFNLPARAGSSDFPDVFAPGTDTIMELKCYRREFPVWMLDMIRTFNLQRTSFSKYGAALLESGLLDEKLSAGTESLGENVFSSIPARESVI